MTAAERDGGENGCVGAVSSSCIRTVVPLCLNLITWMSLPATRRHQRLCPQRDRRLLQPSAHWAAPSAGSWRTWGTHWLGSLDQLGHPFPHSFPNLCLYVSTGSFWAKVKSCEAAWSHNLREVNNQEANSSFLCLLSLALLSGERGRVGSKLFRITEIERVCMCVCLWVPTCFNEMVGLKVEQTTGKSSYWILLDAFSLAGLGFLFPLRYVPVL